jgi:magnesium transporter
LNLANDNFLDGLERDVLEDDPTLARAIAVAGQNILTLKKLVASLQTVLMLLATEYSVFISQESRSFYREMLQNAATVRAAVDSSRDLLDGIVASLQARAAQRTGDIARVLTVVSTIILPLSLVAGVYGMNFEFMPELSVPWAYFAVLAGMVVAAATLLAVFWRLGWLARGGGGTSSQRRRRFAERS